MKRIRIGNDIRVQTSLHDLNDFDLTSIKQLRCYFIPQSEDYTSSTSTDTYDPMQYNICDCGKPKYNVFPCNIDAPHWFCGYNGFGVNSKPFIHVDNKYLAQSRLLPEQNRIEAYFPAKAQFQIGEYKLVIVLTLYQPGWCDNNLRTITLDEGVVFALTSDDRDINTNTVIDLDVKENEIVSIRMTNSNNLIIENYKGKCQYGFADKNDNLNSITVKYSDGTEHEVKEDEFDDLFITVINGNNSVKIDKQGAITYNKYLDTPFTIMYMLRSNTQINTTCNYTFAGKYYKLEWKTGELFDAYNGVIEPFNDDYSLDEIYIESGDSRFYDFKIYCEDADITTYNVTCTCNGASIVKVGQTSENGYMKLEFAMENPTENIITTTIDISKKMFNVTVQTNTGTNKILNNTLLSPVEYGSSSDGNITVDPSSSVKSINASYKNSSGKVSIKSTQVGSNVWYIELKNIIDDVIINFVI